MTLRTADATTAGPTFAGDGTQSTIQMRNGPRCGSTNCEVTIVRQTVRRPVPEEVGRRPDGRNRYRLQSALRVRDPRRSPAVSGYKAGDQVSS